MRSVLLLLGSLIFAFSGCGGGKISGSNGGDGAVDSGYTGSDTSSTTDQNVPNQDMATADAMSDSQSVPDGYSGDGAVTDGAEPDASPTLACNALIPSAGYNAVAVPLIIDGQLFEEDAAVELVNLVSSNVATLDGAVITDVTELPGLDHIEVLVPIDTPEGTYAVRISQSGGEATVDCGTYVSTAQQPPTVTEVTPDTAWEGSATDAVLSDQPVSISGTGFRPTPSVRFINKTTREIFVAPSVSWISDTALTAVVPSESQRMAVGDYAVEVINPSRLSGVWTLSDETEGTFRITGTPPPRIDDVTPTKALSNAGGGTAPPAVVISGDYFTAETKLYLLLSAEEEPKEITSAVTDRSIDPDGPDTITFDFDVNNDPFSITIGMYPLRLVNPDGQYDTFFALQVENASEGKLNVGEWTPVTQLQYPRERHDSVQGFDVFGNAYLYVMGGTSLPVDKNLETRPRPVLSNTEIVQVDVFGDPTATSQLALQIDPDIDFESFDVRRGTLRVANEFVTPRTGHTVVRAGAWLYAIGGANEDTWSSARVGSVMALNTVESAKILGYDTMPNVSLPQVTRTASKGLPRGTWYYRVSAVLGAAGESLPSREVVAQDAGGEITLKWLPVEGATSYLIYRSLASDGRLGTTRLLATNVTATTFTDDGQDDLTPAPGRLAGSLEEGGALGDGVWAYRVTAVVSGVAGTGETLASYPTTMTVAAEGTAKTVALTWDAIPGATYNVYRSNAAGEDATYLLASGLSVNAFTDDGSGSIDTESAAPEGIVTLTTGSLSQWQTISSTLTTGREGAESVVVRAVDGDTSTTDDPSYIFVVGGRADNATGVDYLRTTERALIGDDGQLGAFALAVDDGGTTVELNSPRGFFGLVTTQGRTITPVAPPPEIPPCPDNDGDGLTSCLCGGTDCNDSDSSVYPGADEICGDGIDQDCDQGCAGGSDEVCPNLCDVDNGDADGDGYKRPECGGNDCNDAVATICPSGTKCPETCGDGIDQNCDGSDLACDACDADGGDADGDGFKRPQCGGDDCDDSDDTICPDYTKCPDINCDGIDQNCDGYYACLIVNDPNVTNEAVQVWAYEPRITQSTPLFPPATQLIANGEDDESPVYLAALFGETIFPTESSQVGLDTAEVCLVTKQGNLTAWTVQTDHPNQTMLGNTAVLYGNFAYSFQGTQTEGGPDADPSGIRNEVVRFEIDPDTIDDWTTPVSAAVLMAPDAGWPAGAPVPASEHPRCYLSAVRLSARLFLVAGNAGTGIGPVSTIMSIQQ